MMLSALCKASDLILTLAAQWLKEGKWLTQSQQENKKQSQDSNPWLHLASKSML